MLLIKKLYVSNNYTNVGSRDRENNVSSYAPKCYGEVCSSYFLSMSKNDQMPDNITWVVNFFLHVENDLLCYLGYAN